MQYMELKLTAISDTHTKHKNLNLPGGDILIHSGDCSYQGYANEILNFLAWLEQQKSKYTNIVLIPGNHDFGFETDLPRWKDECETRGISLLHDSGVELQGIRFWGSGVSPRFNDWAFNRDRGADIARHWDLIPEDTEILVTHGPPNGILDLVPRGEFVGCEDLLDKVLKTQVKLHVFGHIHEAKGHLYKHGKTFVNASSLDGRYQPDKDGYTQILRDEDGIYHIVEPI